MEKKIILNLLLSLFSVSYLCQARPTFNKSSKKVSKSNKTNKSKKPLISNTQLSNTESSNIVNNLSSSVTKLHTFATNSDFNDVFDKLVLNNDRPCVVKFTAKWCGPCKMMAKAFEEAAIDYSGLVDFIEIDIDQCPKVKSRFGVDSVPQMHFYAPVKNKAGRNQKSVKKSKKVAEFCGSLNDKQQIINQVKTHLKV